MPDLSKAMNQNLNDYLVAFPLLMEVVQDTPSMTLIQCWDEDVASSLDTLLHANQYNTTIRIAGPDLNWLVAVTH